VIQRAEFSIESTHLDQGRCPFCYTAIHGVWDRKALRAALHA
jgi:hypothetical protein